MEDAIEILTKMLIKEHLTGENRSIIMKKEDLYKFCIKLLKVVQLNK